MKPEELKSNFHYWCYWLHRILLYNGKTDTGLYIFEDFGDALFYFTEQQVHDLQYL